MAAMVPGSELYVGVAASVAYSAMVTAQLVLNKWMDQHGVQIWLLLAPSMALTCCISLPVALATKVAWPELRQLKWVAARAVCLLTAFLFSNISVGITGAPGDTNALVSINVVVACALGHVFLGERLRWMHIVAVASALLGATLISRPQFLFGGSSDASLFLGHACALAAGFFRAAALVCARKSGLISVHVISFIVGAIGAVFFAVFPWIGLLPPQALAEVSARPAFSAIFVCTNVSIQLVGGAMGALGSTLCPAAVSATMFTACGISLGYFAQALLFQAWPDAPTLGGAALMILAVVIMTYFRVSRPVASSSTPAPAANAEGSVDIGEPGLSPCPDDASEVESLFSFVAAEFAEVAAHESFSEARVRRRSTIVEQVLQAEQLGRSEVGAAQPGA